MSLEEAKKTYRTLAKTMHPDVGGDTEEFKVLANEYAAIERGEAEAVLVSIDDIMDANAKRLEVIVATLRELYPRTKVLLHYSYDSIEMEFPTNVPLARMVELERVVNSFNYPFAVTVSFYREGRKSPITFKTERGCVTYINMQPGTPVILSEPSKVYSGRRYTIYQDKRHEECWDSKLNHRYVMRRMPKITLQGLLGLGK